MNIDSGFPSSKPWTRRALVLSGVAAAGLSVVGLSACRQKRYPTDPPVNPPPPADPSLYEETASIPKALNQVLAKVGPEKVLYFDLQHQSMSLRTKTKEFKHTASGIEVTDRPAKAEWQPIDPRTLKLNNWHALRAAAKEVFGWDGDFGLRMHNAGTWGLPTAEFGVVTHHASQQRQVDETLTAIPELNFMNPEHVAQARKELSELAGITQISEFLMHKSTIGVNAPYDKRFGPAGDKSGGVSLHRTSQERSNYNQMSSSDIVPSPSTLFAMSDVDEPLIARLRQELKLSDGGWKVIVRREGSELVYRFEVGKEDRDFDSQGRPR